jgi:hypothetical protein
VTGLVIALVVLQSVSLLYQMAHYGSTQALVKLAMSFQRRLDRIRRP